MSGSMKRRVPRWLWLGGFTLALLLLVVGLTACSVKPTAKAAAVVLPPPGAPAAPDWLATAPANVKEAYVWAAAHHKELQYIPCYCGCEQVHGNNADCYFKWDGNSTIKDYEIHAFG